MAMLRLTYQPDDEWLGRVGAEVDSNGFSGIASAWFDRASIADDFIPALCAYPISVAALPRIESPVDGRAEQGGLSRDEFRILIEPYNARGTLLAQVDLAAPVYGPSGTRFQSVAAHFFCDYASIARFAAALRAVLDGSREEAVLHGADGW